MHIAWASDDAKLTTVLVRRNVKARVPVKRLEFIWQIRSFHVGSYSNGRQKKNTTTIKSCPMSQQYFGEEILRTQPEDNTQK